MRIRQRKVCGRCRALCEGHGDIRFCTLGYKTMKVWRTSAGEVKLFDMVPMEPCPKPITLTALAKAPAGLGPIFEKAQRAVAETIKREAENERRNSEVMDLRLD